MEWIIIPIIFFGVILVTAVLFGGWVILTLFRLVFRGLNAMANPAPMRPSPIADGTAANGLRCTNARCRYPNPGIAQFCRHCGAVLPAVQRVPVRRAAMC